MKVRKKTTGILLWKEFAVVLDNGKEQQTWVCRTAQDQGALVSALEQLLHTAPKGSVVTSRFDGSFLAQGPGLRRYHGYLRGENISVLIGNGGPWYLGLLAEWVECTLDPTREWTYGECDCGRSSA